MINISIKNLISFELFVYSSYDSYYEINFIVFNLRLTI